MPDNSPRFRCLRAFTSSRRSIEADRKTADDLRRHAQPNGARCSKPLFAEDIQGFHKWALSHRQRERGHGSVPMQMWSI